MSVPASSQLSSLGSTSMSTAPATGTLVLQASQCSVTKACRQPPTVFLPKLVYDVLVSTDSSGLPKAASLLPAPSVMWTSSFRPLLSKTMTSTEQSLYYRQWTVPRPSHMDYGNRAEGRVDSFHPRRLLLSGPPQVRAEPAVLVPGPGRQSSLWSQAGGQAAGWPYSPILFLSLGASHHLRLGPPPTQSQPALTATVSLHVT